ncbi:MAG TPA: hypothetical protein VEJ84_05805 [Acidimicrobiales bacterium]|nr:hypothetical protein [Acidimicrobiales bacterium]
MRKLLAALAIFGVTMLPMSAANAENLEQVACPWYNVFCYVGCAIAHCSVSPVCFEYLLDGPGTPVIHTCS